MSYLSTFQLFELGTECTLKPEARDEHHVVYKIAELHYRVAKGNPAQTILLINMNYIIPRVQNSQLFPIMGAFTSHLEPCRWFFFCCGVFIVMSFAQSKPSVTITHWGW